MTRQHLPVAALVLVVVVNALVLAGVSWNRHGPPEATLVLTERELPLSYSMWSGDENTGVSLTLDLPYDLRRPDWLDAARLRELGFRPSPVGGCNGRLPLSRRALLVLEFDGPAWQDHLQSRERELEALTAGMNTGKATEDEVARAAKALRQLRIGGSRLVPVDAGEDAGVLRDRYPDTGHYLITPAEIRMDQGAIGDCSPAGVRGHVEELLVGRIQVPAQLQPALSRALGGGRLYGRRRTWPDHDAEPVPPHYRVTLQIGRRLEPWIVAIEALPVGSEH